jgi:hypothetical protein
MGEGTFARAPGNDENAPIPALRGRTIVRLKSTQVCHWAAIEPFPKAVVRRAAAPTASRPFWSSHRAGWRSGSGHIHRSY